ncbi:hypothetical protein H4S07_000451 [Coemansia furcata]|uniref:Uncharacterized protein n=1 Tax=Coemansia furcata TaxID=417177 RepID=A0ACC1LS80_9FUNG|nr:hypothetical protein H4S07_000451 [Coemansia furcata]
MPDGINKVMLPEYVVSTCAPMGERFRFDRTEHGHGQLLLPLLSVCHNLRSVAVFHYSKIFTIRIAPTSYEGSALLSYWMSHFGSTSFPTYLYARDVYFHLDYLDICRGTAMDVLSRKPFSDCTFPRALSLFVALMPRSPKSSMIDGRITPSTIESNIREFVRHIKKAAPLIRKVLISTTFSSSDIPQVYEHHWGSLVKQLGQLADNVEYKIYSRPMRLEMQPAGLSYLMYADMDKKNDDSTLVLQIARRSASTLQYLCIQFSKLDDISPLIQSAAGDVQYPRLHMLRLEAAATFSLTKWPTHPGVVPFPRLQHLTIETEYCFGDDTPFRGNARSLLYLDLNLGPKLVEILKRHGVFTPLSHPKLHCVRLGQRSLPEQKLFTTNAKYIRYVLSIGPHAPVRDIKCSLHAPLFKSLVPMFGEYAKIQVLELPNTPLMFWDVIELTKALPLLSDLCTYFSPGADLPDGLTERELPVYVCKNYYPAGKRFRCWRLLILQGQNFEFAAKSVLLLALACPNFDYAAVPAANRPLFMAHMKRIIRADEFKEHASRLRRLLFGGWKNKITSVKAAQPEMDLMSLLTALAG